MLKIKNTLKKVQYNKDIYKKNEDSDDNISHIKSAYIDKKNSLRRVNTQEKSLLNHLKPQKKIKIKKNNKKSKEIEVIENKKNKDIIVDLEKQLEIDLEREFENICK